MARRARPVVIPIPTIRTALLNDERPETSADLRPLQAIDASTKTVSGCPR